MSSPARNMDESPKLRKADRVIIVKPIDGKKALSTSGLVDTRLFTGDNKLHAVRDGQNMLWSLKMEAGGLAEPLRQRFKTFDSLLEFVRTYFRKRNIEITEVID